MYYTEPLTFESILHDIPARKLPDNILQSGENIIFENGVIKARYGIARFGITSLGDEITGISQYKKLRKKDRYVVAFTNKDIYVYSLTSGRFELKTRNYNVGTIATSGTGNRTITLTGGTWNIAWNKTNLYQISFDSSKIEDCSTWHTVSTITSTTGLTLTADAPLHSGVYCLRLCYAGDADDNWFSCYPYADTAQDRIILCTNGIDRVQYWDSTGYFKDFENFPYLAKYIGFFGSNMWEHVIFANTYDTGSFTSFEQTMSWLNAGGALTYDDHYTELLDSSEPITGVVPLGNRLMIYKTDSISIADVNPNGGNVSAFFITQDIAQFGTPSVRTVCNIGDYHIIFTGNDIRLFDGHNSKIISEGNSQFIVHNLNREFQHRAFAFILPEQNLYCLFLPFKPSEFCNTCIVYNYKTESWTYWTFNDLNGNTLLPMSKGKYVRTYAPQWQSLKVTPTGNTTLNSNVITSPSSITGIERGMKVTGANIPEETYITALSPLTMTKNATGTATGSAFNIGWTAEQMPHRWTDLIVDERYTRILMGDSAGNIYNYAVEFNNDNNFDIDSSFMTKDYDLNKAGYDFRLLECTLMMQLKDDYAPATIDIRASVDFGRNWSAWITLPLDGNASYMEKKVNFNMMGKQVRFEVRMSNPLIFESMTIGFNAQYKSMKFDN